MKMPLKKKQSQEAISVFHNGFSIITKSTPGNFVFGQIKKGGCICMAPRGAREGPAYFKQCVQHLSMSKNDFPSYH